MHARFFIENKIGDGKEIVISDQSQIHQISRVFRMKQKDMIVVLDNTGFEFECEIRQLNKKLILLKVLNKKENKNDPILKVNLFQSLIKKDKMEFVFEKCTEIGVSKFYPVLSKNSVKLSFNKTRAKKILKEATEQSKRGIIPELEDALKFKNAINLCKIDDINIIFHEKEEEKSFDFLNKSLKNIDKSKNINIFVGPEGGFSDEEIKLAKKHNFNTLSLGKRTLKSETFAIVSSFFILSFD